MGKGKAKSILKNICIIVFIAIFCAANIFTTSISDLDEIWNYNFAKNIADGLVPYKDFNMVQMPLLSMLSAVILKIFGNQLFTMRVLAVILMVAIFFMVYKILKIFSSNNVPEISLILLLYLYKDIMCIDYNYAVLLIALILLYCELKNGKMFEYKFKYNFVLGLIAGLAVLCKQTTGVALVLACAGYKILAIRKKDDIKDFFKIAFTRLLGALIPFVAFIIYLLFNNAVIDFWSYTVLGLKNFSNSISYLELFNTESIGVTILSAFVPITLIFVFIMLFNKAVPSKLYPLFAYGISSFVVVFPISDKIHFLIGALITIIMIIYLVQFYGIEESKKELPKKFKESLYSALTFCTVFLLLAYMYISINTLSNKFINTEKEDLNHFANIPINNGLNERIKEIDEYILEKQSVGKKVYILDAEAAIYNIPLDIYNKDYDMFLKGNLGKDGENGIIARIENEADAIYLIKKDNLNWQNPTKVREYIINNLENTEEISIFLVYEKD